MAGFLDFIFSTPRQKEERERRQVQGEAFRGALGRRPGVGPFLPGQGGSGLLADPSDPSRQAEFAGAIGGVAPAAGSQLLSGIFSNFAGQEQTETTQAGALERQELAGEQAAERGEADIAGRQRVAELSAQISRLNALDQIQGRADVAASGGGQPGFEFGPVGTGMVRIMDPQAGPLDIGLPGAEPHNKARTQLRNARRSTETVFKIQKLIEDEGFDLVGGSRGEFDFLRTSLQGDLTELLNLGVINSPAEMERIMELAPDANLIRKTIGNLGVDAADNAIRAKYQLLFDLMDDKYNEFATRYARWPGMDDLLPEAVPQ